MNTSKRTEQILYVHSGKPEAEVTNNKRLRLRHRTAEANYRQTRSIERLFLRQQSYLFDTNFHARVPGEQDAYFAPAIKTFHTNALSAVEV